MLTMTIMTDEEDDNEDDHADEARDDHVMLMFGDYDDDDDYND